MLPEDFFPFSFVFPNLPCPYSFAGNGNFGYNQHQGYPSRAICQNPQGECIASLLPVVHLGKARLPGAPASEAVWPGFVLQKVERTLHHNHINTEKQSLLLSLNSLCAPETEAFPDYGV